MFSQFGMIVALERPMLVVKVQNGLYNSNSLQQNSLEVLESCVGMILISAKQGQLLGTIIFSMGLFFNGKYMSNILQFK